MTRQAKLLFMVTLCSASVVADVYQWQDEFGRIQYSDKPPENSDAQSIPLPQAQGYQQGGHSSGHLESAARQLKKDRLNREKAQRQERQRKKRLHAAWQAQKKKKLANQQACAKAEKKADLAFRNRMQRTGLNQAGKAFENYEKARQKARVVCH